MAVERGNQGQNFEPPRPPILQDPLSEHTIPIARTLGSEVRRRIYTMKEFREAKKRQVTGERNKNVKFETDFKGKHYNYIVSYEPHTSLLSDDPTIFTVKRSWIDLDLGPNPEDKLIVSETVSYADSRKDPKISYTWERSDRPQDTFAHENEKAEADIKHFLFFLEE